VDGVEEREAVMDEHTVVVGVDGSPESGAALRLAMREAGWRGATVRVVTVYFAPEYWAASYGLAAQPTIEEVIGSQEAVAREQLDGAVAEEPALKDVPVQVVALPGPPAKVLIEQSDGADLLVVGHRGRGGFASAMLGSVGLQCVLHATCPVTVVRPAREPASAPRIAEDAGPAFVPTY
jgi:nucleotide-binding universal stress UspA family protein